MERIEAVYVINLDEDTRRLQQVLKEGAKFNKPIFRVSAVKGSNLTLNEQKQATSLWCNLFCTKSMIGCFMSHRKTWQVISENNIQGAIILEDDCTILDSPTDVLNHALLDLRNIDPDWDVLYLGNFGVVNTDQNALSPFLYKPYMPLAAHGYVVSLKGAKRLLDMLNKVNGHVDVNMGIQGYLNGLRYYGTRPMIAFQNASVNQSTQIDSQFPTTLNLFMNNIKDAVGIPFSFHFSSPFMQISGLPITPYIVLLCLISCIVPKSTMSLVVLSFWFLVEMMLNPNIVFRIAIYWILALTCFWLK